MPHRSDEWAILECFHALPITFEKSTEFHAGIASELFCIACQRLVPVSTIVEFGEKEDRNIAKAQLETMERSFRLDEEEL